MEQAPPTGKGLVQRLESKWTRWPLMQGRAALSLSWESMQSLEF
jgi:hypothetical protein